MHFPYPGKTLVIFSLFRRRGTMINAPVTYLWGTPYISEGIPYSPGVGCATIVGTLSRTGRPLMADDRISSSNVERYRNNYLAEMDGIALYRTLASVEKDGKRAEIFEQLRSEEHTSELQSRGLISY